MTKVIVTKEYLDDIGDSIRGKNGSSTKYKPSQMSSAIDNIPTGTDTSDATLDSNAEMLSGYTAYADGVKYTGSIPTKTSSDLTASTLTVTVPSGYYASNATKTLTDSNLVAGNIKNGTTIFGVTGTYSGGGSGKNVQIYFGTASRTANSYGATSVTLTVAKTGTYKVSWIAWRGSSTGTMGTNLYKNSTSGTNQQTWTGTYGQCITLNNQSYQKDDVLTLYATSGSNSRTVYVGNLIIEEQ